MRSVQVKLSVLATAVCSPSIFFLSVFFSAIAFLLMTQLGCQSRVPKDQPHQDGKYVDVEPTDAAAAEAFTPAYKDHFHMIDGQVNAEGKYVPLELTELEIKGRNAWMLWTGGNEVFWDWLARNGYGSIELLKVIDSDKQEGRFARTGLITEPGMRPPTKEETKASFGIRFARPKQDYYKYSPYSDSPPDPDVYGYSTGIVGLRIFKNPEFFKSKTAQRRWEKNRRRFYSDADADKAWASNPNTVKPYIVGMSCAICHASLHPLNPPADVENPKWENISSTIGAQYLRIREIFGNNLEPDNYLYHVIDSQLPGTIDTSLVATDQINNANTMNAIFGLGARVKRSLENPPEKLSEASYGPKAERYPGVWDPQIAYGPNQYYPPLFDVNAEDYAQKQAAAIAKLEGNPRYVPRVLVDGSDSVGTWIALARVYLNIGTYHQQWSRTHNTILGFKEQTPFRLKDCEEKSVYWHGTRIRVDSITAYFLKSTDPMKLKDAIGLPKSEKFPEINNDDFSGLPNDPLLEKGREVFALGCIACHSSKQPDTPGFVVKDAEHQEIKAQPLKIDDLWRLTRGDGELPADYARWAKHAVNTQGFWEDNYLSTDMRIPVTMTGTNSARAMATNAKTHQVWDDFASLTFKNLPSVGKIKYPDPFSGAQKEYQASSGGPGYYRVPTLISAWATAPYLHNNSLGTFNNDPSVKGRLEAFNDAFDKLLTPSNRFAKPHDLAKLNPQQVRSSEELINDGGLVWRTSESTHFKIRGHQIPVLIRGMTTWNSFSVGLVPWIPSLLFAVIGLVILLKEPIKEFLEKRALWLLRFFRWFYDIFVQFRKPIGLVLTILTLVLLILWWIYLLPVIRLVEIGSGWSIGWINLQIIVLFLISGVVIIWLTFPNILGNRTISVVYLVAAVIFALGFGRFASGQGGDIALGPFPKGMPVNLIVNMDHHAPPKKLFKAVSALTSHFLKYAHQDDDETALLDFEENVAPLLQEVSSCPDLVLDRGHDYKFMRHFTDEQKAELKKLIKTF